MRWSDQFDVDEKKMNTDELLLVYTDLYCNRPAHGTYRCMARAYSKCTSPNSFSAYGDLKGLKTVFRHLTHKNIHVGRRFTGIHRMLQAWNERGISVSTLKGHHSDHFGN